MRLYFYFSPQLMFYTCFFQLRFKQDFQRQDEFALFFTSKIHISKFSFSQRTTNFKIIKRPLFSARFRDSILDNQSKILLYLKQLCSDQALYQCRLQLIERFTGMTRSEIQKTSCLSLKNTQLNQVCPNLVQGTAATLNAVHSKISLSSAPKIQKKVKRFSAPLPVSEMMSPPAKKFGPPWTRGVIFNQCACHTGVLRIVFRCATEVQETDPLLVGPMAVRAMHQQHGVP